MNSDSIDTIDNKKLEDFMMKAVNDMSGALGSMMIILGERLGLYKTLYQYGPLTSIELSEKTNTSERYIREWLASQAAGG
jgi:hypothetical protein